MNNEPTYCPTCKIFTTNHSLVLTVSMDDDGTPYCLNCENDILPLTIADAPAALAAYVVYKLRENLRLDDAIEEVKRGETIELGDFTHFNSIEELMADLNDSSSGERYETGGDKQND